MDNIQSENSCLPFKIISVHGHFIKQNAVVPRLLSHECQERKNNNI